MKICAFSLAKLRLRLHIAQNPKLKHFSTAAPWATQPCSAGFCKWLNGKKKHVITVDAMVRLDLPPGVATLALGADVNELEMHPTGTMGTNWSALQECPNVGMGCTVTATLIMDLDNAELLSPGHFINQPLTIILWAGDAGPGGGVGQPVDVSMVVRMEKKR